MVTKECNWFTFYPSINVCQELHNCSSIDVPACPECLTGQSGCQTEEPVCWVPGECKGNLLGIFQSETEQVSLNFLFFH
jgi:hypothetical protein